MDAVVEAGDGRWAAFEIKLGTGHIDAGAINLMKFVERVDTGKCGPPALLGVIVGTGYGYIRKDGVAVIPVGALIQRSATHRREPPRRGPQREATQTDAPSALI